MSSSHCTLRLESTDCCRLSKNKPKPNTRFLKNIIKETDSHNAALRAKEVQDAKSRLQRLQGAQEESSESKDRMGDEVYHRQKRRRIDHSEVVLKKTHRKPLEESKGDSSRESKRSRRYHEHDQTGHVDNSEDERTRHRRHRHRHRSHRPRSRERSRDRDNRAPRRRSSRRRDLSNLSDGDRGDRHDRKRRRRRPASLSSSTDSALPHSVDRRISGTSASPQSEMEKDKGARQQKSIGNESDSDPLESIIGPLPPHVPKIQARGRGTFKSSSAIDSHFSSKYDPSEDVHPNSDSETSWDQALEALRDRQRWKQQGANRLRSAGFTEEVVGKWERGGEKKQEDVRWSGKGEKREWDRGKIMGETGVETKAEWALSKGCAHRKGIFGEYI